MNSVPVQKSKNTNPTEGKYWGVWLPVPTIIAIINSIFWTWLISNTVGLTEAPKTTESENAVIEQF